MQCMEAHTQVLFNDYTILQKEAEHRQLLEPVPHRHHWHLVLMQALRRTWGLIACELIASVTIASGVSMGCAMHEGLEDAVGS